MGCFTFSTESKTRFLGVFLCDYSNHFEGAPRRLPNLLLSSHQKFLQFLEPSILGFGFQMSQHPGLFPLAPLLHPENTIRQMWPEEGRTHGVLPFSSFSNALLFIRAFNTVTLCLWTLLNSRSRAPGFLFSPRKSVQSSIFQPVLM